VPESGAVPETNPERTQTAAAWRRKHEGAPIMAHPVVHFEVIGPDGKALQQFYRQAFGWNVDANNPMDYGIVTGNGGGIDGGVAAGPEGRSHVTFYIETDDMQATLAAIQQHGGKTVMPPDEIPGMQTTIAQFSDPAGNIVGLVKNG
jgi:uncharacterized protein